MSFQTQSSKKNNIFKAYWSLTCIQNKLAYYVSSILSDLFVLQIYKCQNVSGAWPSEPIPGFCHEPVAGIRAPQDPSYILQHLKTHEYESGKLGSSFNRKDQRKLEQKHNLTYLVKCPENTCSETYLDETVRRLNERKMEHAGKDKKSHMLKHTLQSGHPSVSPNKLRIFWKPDNNKVKTKV